MARLVSGRLLPPTHKAAQSADAGDCFAAERDGGITCLPGMINIGVQKAGTGELQTWLSVHPLVKAHGGEVHFFDREDFSSPCTSRNRARLRLRYARFLWKRQRLRQADMRGRLMYEKTPAYFDLAQPRQVACTVPAARILVMLRDPSERARSAYAMCQRELEARWCRPAFAAVVDRMLIGGNSSDASVLHVSRREMRRKPHLRRLFLMGHYSAFLRRWLDVFPTAHVRVIWLEQFKVDPFACMRAVERFAGLAPHPYAQVATRNAAGLYVVGRSKSTYERQPAARIAQDEAVATAAALQAAMATVRAYYAPWQRRLAELLAITNTTLVHVPPPPL